MGKNVTAYSAVLGVEHVLLEFSDVNHPVSISFIKNKLKEIYDIDVSDDVLREKLLPAMMSFRAKKCKDIAGLDPGWRILSNADGKSKKKKGLYWVEGRLFEPYEVNYLSDAVDSLLFLGEGQSDELLKRINSLQSSYQRPNNRMRRTSSSTKVKPGYQVLEDLLDYLNEAIADKKSISFNYMRYDTTRKKGKVDEQEVTLDVCERLHGSRIEKCSPYRIQLMDGHYFLLTSAKDKTINRDRFKVFRVDLIKDLEIEEENAYIPLTNDDAPADYFRGAINGIGGQRKPIQLRCSKKAIHYVIERFVEFEDFKVWKRADDPDGWYDVQFKAHPKAVEYYVYRFLSDIELLAPEKTRENIKKYLRKTPYLDLKREDVLQVDGSL